MTVWRVFLVTDAKRPKKYTRIVEALTDIQALALALSSRREPAAPIKAWTAIPAVFLTPNERRRLLIHMVAAGKKPGLLGAWE